MNTRLAATIGILVLLLAPPADAGTKTISCYPAIYDRDGDGYAMPEYTAMAVTSTGVIYRTVTVEPVTLTVDSSKLNCPSGYVNEGGDCDDDDAAIHPRRSEVAFNGVDENCSGAADESEWIYGATGNGNTDTSFRMTLRLNRSELLAAVPDLYVRVRYSPLTNTGLSYTTTFPVTRVDWFRPTVTVTLTGLTPSTVYRASAFLQRGDGTVLDVLPYYYTTTDVAPFWGEPYGATRTQIVLRALKEYDESERGRVGYRGSVDPDGTRYGASLNEKWCTEFYTWVTGPWFAYSWLFSTDTTEGMAAFFAAHDAWYGWSAIPTLARRGDYVGIDTEDDGDVNHSGMVLAVDRATTPARVWTVEGNISGHRVAVKLRHAGVDALALGRITGAVLE